MKFFIESSTFRLEKDYPTKTNDYFNNIDDDDTYEIFVENIEVMYDITLDFCGENDSIGYSIVDDILSEVEHQNLFKEFTDFLDVNL
jgi:hypothetical protein